jgi:predicted small lipoprotein YifL
LPFHRSLRIARIAIVGALVGALGLAGCGRKGGLDPPPGASVPDGGAAATPAAPPEIGPDGRPLPPPRRTPLDWLID